MNNNASRRRAGFLFFAALLTSAWTSVGSQEPSLLDRWEETLLYGIDSEVGAVLSQIEQSGETSLDDEIVRRFLQTRTDSLREDIVEHFASRNSPILADGVREL